MASGPKPEVELVLEEGEFVEVGRGNCYNAPFM